MVEASDIQSQHYIPVSTSVCTNGYSGQSSWRISSALLYLSTVGGGRVWLIAVLETQVPSPKMDTHNNNNNNTPKRPRDMIPSFQALSRNIYLMLHPIVSVVCPQMPLLTSGKRIKYTHIIIHTHTVQQTSKEVYIKDIQAR